MENLSVIYYTTWQNLNVSVNELQNGYSEDKVRSVSRQSEKIMKIGQITALS
jgi:hypothetical protein